MLTISSLACLEFKTTRPNCYVPCASPSSLLHPFAPRSVRMLVRSIETTLSRRRKGKLRASRAYDEMHADSGRPVKAYQGWRRSAKGRGRGWGTGNEETAPEKTVLAAVCRLTYVQGTNVSYRWTCARENKDTPPQEDQGRKATDKKGWELFERVAARVCGELRRTSGTIAALRGLIKLNSYEFGLYQVLPREHITCTKSKHAFTTCSFVTFVFT